MRSDGATFLPCRFLKCGVVISILTATTTRQEETEELMRCMDEGIPEFDLLPAPYFLQPKLECARLR